MSLPSWEKGTVDIVVGNVGRKRSDDIIEGVVPVDALIFGPFAVHKSRNTYGWTVTHREQGRLINDGIENRAAARWLCEHLYLLLPDWSVITPGAIPSGIRQQFAELINEVKQCV